ncbi:MAG: septal ring lytic transglycosylase RlpA family protein [Acidimicrobiia bacterium]
MRVRRKAVPRHLAGPRPGTGEAPAAVVETGGEPVEAGPAAPLVPRHRLVFAVASTVVALPVMVVDNLPDPGQGTTVAAVQELTSTAAPSTTTTTAALPTTSAPTTTVAPPTTTTAAPRPAPTAPPTTTAAPRPKPTVASVAATPRPAPTTVAPTTTAAPEPPTSEAPAAEAPPANSESGQASWYAQPAKYAPGGCAHKTLPFGTTVTVTRDGGGSAVCVVSDRGPFTPGRVIDLDDDVFAQLAPLGTGVIKVTISW